MNEMNFTEEDKQKVIEFLNIIAKNAKFKFNTEEVIKYFKLIAHMQQKILPKIDSHILEIKRIVENPSVQEVQTIQETPKAKGKK